MNEDERGITPADVTAITVEPLEDKNWRVTIEQGNGETVKLIDLTEMERIQLGLLLDSDSERRPTSRVSFMDVLRAPVN